MVKLRAIATKLTKWQRRGVVMGRYKLYFIKIIVIFHIIRQFCSWRDADGVDRQCTIYGISVFGNR